MLDQLNQKLTQARERVRSKKKITSKLREVRRQCSDLHSRLDALTVQLEKEQKDVNTLEGTSLTAVFYSVLGTKEERLEKERQEYLAAKLKFDEATRLHDTATAERRRLEEELNQHVGVEDELENLLKEKGELIQGSGGARANELLSYSERLADLHADCRELEEALSAGQEAIDSLNRVSSDLRSAGNLGTWDLLGGGALVTLAKHSKIDSAKQHARSAQEKLMRFQEELADADQRLEVSLELDNLTRFGDLFFDGLIMDWVVQSKIGNAQNACAGAIASTEHAVHQCQKVLELTRQEIENVRLDREQFLEDA